MNIANNYTQDDLKETLTTKEDAQFINEDLNVGVKPSPIAQDHL
jgi:hypothetical protein